MKISNLFCVVGGLFLLLSACKSQKVTQTPPVEEEVSIPNYVPEPSDYQPSNTRVHDLLHTKLEVSFDWEKQYLLGKATLTLKPYFYSSRLLELNAKGFDIKTVSLLQEGVAKELSFEYDSLILSIDLAKEYTRKEQYTLEIEYVAKPNELTVGGSAAINEDKGLYFINPLGEQKDKPRQIWTQGETEASSCWFPTIDSPNEKTTQEMYITVDSTFLTVSNGSLVYSLSNEDGTRTDYWKQELPHAPYLFMMAIGEFAVVKDEWRGKEVSYYVEKEYESAARGIFGNTPEMMEFFSNKLGVDYPWDKYSQIVVRDFVSGAMENTSAAIFMEGLHLSNRELLDKDWDYIIAHELFHHWFGDLVTCESWSNLPLNESFANYSEYLWFEYKYGKDRADYHREDELQGYLRESRSKQEPLIRYHYVTREDMFDAHSYNKGGRVLHMLRNYVGDDAFFASLQLYLSSNEFKPAEIHHLRLAFEEVTGQDLNWFFNQWFLSPGHPVLRVSQEYKDGVLEVQVEQLQNVDYAPVYRLPTEVAVWVKGERLLFPVVVDSINEVFTFEVSAQPDLVLFDPEYVILGEVNQTHSVDEYVYQYAHEKAYLARFNAVFGVSSNPYSDPSLAYNPILDSTECFNTMFNALSDPFWNVRSMALLGLSRYEGEFKDKLYVKVEQMAKADEDTHVRAEAISFLSNKDSIAVNYSVVYEQGVQDSSYVVNAASLLAYLKTEKDSVAKKQVIRKAMLEKNGEISLALADYFVEQQDTTKCDWFLSKFNDLTKGDKINFVKTWVATYEYVSPSRQLEIVDALHQSGIEGLSIYDRFSGYLGLFMLADDVSTTDKRKEVVEKESNPMLEKAYSRREESLAKK